MSAKKRIKKPDFVMKDAAGNLYLGEWKVSPAGTSPKDEHQLELYRKAFKFKGSQAPEDIPLGPVLLSGEVLVDFEAGEPK